VDALRTIAETRRARAALTRSVGLVPTMGFLHDGHLSLVRRARAENDHVIVSIFVNPTQFGPNEDLATYPRDEGRDLALLEAAGVDLVFAPTVDAVYPEGFETAVDVGSVAAPLEGTARPGHFRGVATVVLKLLNIVQPTRAYFGRKDAQQLAVVRRLVADLDLPVEVVACETVREPDGLALSSRNVYLNPTERKAATVLWQALTLARDLWTKGTRDAEAYRRRLGELIAAEPLATADYVSVADPVTLREIDRIQGPALVALAVRIGKTRLIDNLTLGE
jgi:pantoate--beta-alanine ligase